MRELHGRLGLPVRGSGWKALVEHHHDVAADRLLHRDTGFRREEIRFSIYIHDLEGFTRTFFALVVNQVGINASVTCSHE
jgi:hypothetical protein